MQPMKPIRNIEEFIQKVNNKVRSLQHSRCSSTRERKFSPIKGLSPSNGLSPKRKTKTPNKKVNKSSLNPHKEPDLDSTYLNFGLNNNNRKPPKPKTRRKATSKLQKATNVINSYKSELQKAFIKIAELECILNSNDSNKTFYTSYFKDKKTKDTL